MWEHWGYRGGRGLTSALIGPDALMTLLPCALALVDAPTVAEGRDVGVTLGQSGVLECEADAVPEADFQWYKDDRRWERSLQKTNAEKSVLTPSFTLQNPQWLRRSGYCEHWISVQADVLQCVWEWLRQLHLRCTEQTGELQHKLSPVWWVQDLFHSTYIFITEPSLLYIPFMSLAMFFFLSCDTYVEILSRVSSTPLRWK